MPYISQSSLVRFRAHYSVTQAFLDGLEHHTDMTLILVGVRASQKEGGQLETIS
jgi:hypothetical protein